jgi:hypothetical protein
MPADVLEPRHTGLVFSAMGIEDASMLLDPPIGPAPPAGRLGRRQVNHAVFGTPHG